MNDSPLVSIITVCYNSEEYIEDTIKSIQEQTYVNIEHIVVDGNSNDNTLNIIDRYKNDSDNRIKCISEEDEGIYDAMNKGIEMASGDIIGILNSDDFYNNKFVIEKVANFFSNNKIDSLYSDLVYVDPINTDKVIRKWKAGKYKEGNYKWGWHPPHPTFFVKKEVYDKFGKFDLDFTIAADYEIMLRFLEKYNISTLYIPEIFIKMRNGGESNKNISNIIRSNIESYKALGKNNLDRNIFTILCKLSWKIFQLIKGKFHK